MGSSDPEMALSWTLLPNPSASPIASSLMESLAPPVVAVLVAHDPGPWFEESLARSASQSYAELSVLVLDAASAEDLTARVADVLPDAYVRRFDENRGFGATANEVISMVDGADYYLFCHDDVAPRPRCGAAHGGRGISLQCRHRLTQAGEWDDPGRLLEVGMSADKGGSVVDRVQPHEIDHGQHDSVRDVFVAPGGFTLIRADLFGELGGFDPAIVAMGEDLDFCWRAQVAGARIIVAPDARVRHREGWPAVSGMLEPSLVDRVAPAGDLPGTSAAAASARRRRPLPGGPRASSWRTASAKPRGSPRPPTHRIARRRAPRSGRPRRPAPRRPALRRPALADQHRADQHRADHPPGAAAAP